MQTSLTDQLYGPAQTIEPQQQLPSLTDQLYKVEPPPPNMPVVPDLEPDFAKQPRPSGIYQDTSKPNFIRRAADTLSSIIGVDAVTGLSDEAKAQSLVQLMAKEEKLPLHEYRQSPEFLEKAASSFVSMASFGMFPAVRESLTGEIDFRPSDPSGYIGHAIGSLAGLIYGPFQASEKILAPVLKHLPRATQEMSMASRILKEALRDAIVLGGAMAGASAGEAAKSVTFTEAASHIWHSAKSGAMTGAIFGLARGMFPAEGIQKAARIITGLIGLNALRAQEIGGNPFTNRPIEEVLFDIALDTFFLWRGLPRKSFSEFEKDISDLSKEADEIRTAEETVGNIPDGDPIKTAQMKIITAKKEQLENRFKKISDQYSGDIAVREEMARHEEELAKAKMRPVADSGLVKIPAAKRVKAKPAKEMVPEGAEVTHTFTSQSGNEYVKVGDKWFKKDGERVTNRFVIKAAEKKKVEMGKLYEEAPKPAEEAPKTTGRVEVPYKDIKPEAQEVFDALNMPEQFRDKLRRKKKIRVIEHTVAPNENIKIPPTWHDGVFRYTALRPEGGEVIAGEAGSYDTILMPGAVAGAKEGPIPPGNTLYLFDTGVGTDILRIYRTSPKAPKPVGPPALPEPITRIDEMTGEDMPGLKDERSPFFQSPEETEAFKKLFAENPDRVTKDIELFTQKLINDSNRWYHGDDSVDIELTRHLLSDLVTKADDFLNRLDPDGNPYFITGKDHLEWKESLSEAAKWARNLDRGKTQPTPPPDRTVMALDIIDGVDPTKTYGQTHKFTDVVRESRAIDPKDIPHSSWPFTEEATKGKTKAKEAPILEPPKETEIEDVEFEEPFFPEFGDEDLIEEIEEAYVPEEELKTTEKIDKSRELKRSVKKETLIATKKKRPELKDLEEEELRNRLASIEKAREDALAADPFASIKTPLELEKTTLLPSLLRDITKGRPSRTMIYELMQNSLDAFEHEGVVLRRGTDAKIDIYFTEGDAGKPHELLFTDNGKGMTRDEVKTFFLVAGSEGKTGTTTRGGLGQAKVALLLIPERVTLITRKNGIESIASVSREQIFKGEIDIDPRPTTEPDGTTFYAELPKDLEGTPIAFSTIKSAINEVTRGTWHDAEVNVTMERNYGDVDVETYPPRLIENEKTKLPVESFHLDGSDVSVYFVEAPPYGWSYEEKNPVEGFIINKGLIVNIDFRHAITSQKFPGKPDFRVVANFELTPKTTDQRYPFRNNRTELAGKFKKKIKDIADDGIKTIKLQKTVEKGAEFGEMVDRSPEINGVKILIPWEGKLYDKAIEIINNNSDVMTDFINLTNEFTDMLRGMGEDPDNFMLTLDPHVFGYKSSEIMTGYDLYAINPFRISEEMSSSFMFSNAIKAGTDPLHAMSNIMVHALIHEYCHVKEFNHYESFAKEMARIYTGLNRHQLTRLGDRMEAFYGNYEARINSIGRDLKSIFQYEQGLKYGVKGLSEERIARARERVVQALGDTPRDRRTEEELTADKIIKLYKNAKRKGEEARAMKSFKPKEAAGMARREFVTAFVDKSGNIRRDLLHELDNEGYRVLQKHVLSKGASSLAAKNLNQLGKEIFGGLRKDKKNLLNDIIFHARMVDIGKYKSAKEFKHFIENPLEESIAFLELFPVMEGLTPKEAHDLYHVKEDGSIGGRAGGYFNWMQKALKDLHDAELISDNEYALLKVHNYRKVKLVDIYDVQMKPKVGNKKITVYDSGVESLARGRETDIFERDAEVMALEVFNRTYGRVLKNKANKGLLELARKKPDNPFVRIKEHKGDRIPSGWSRIFVFERGERKPMWISPDMAPEWISSGPDISYRMSQLIRYISGAPVLRTMATGINWGFAIANLPRDVMHTWFAARVYENGKWEPIYSPHAPVFAAQIGRDAAAVFYDVILRKGEVNDYYDDGGGLEFLVHQGRLFQRGRHVRGPLDPFFNAMGYFGETSELLIRMAIRRRVMRRRAKEKGITLEEAKKDQEIRDEATFASRDYMDFGQGGWATKAFDNGLPYLNATVQATRSLWRELARHPFRSGYRLAQLASVVAGIYIASKKMTPKTSEALKGNIDMENNICIPLGDEFGFEDEMGQMRYPYLKVPIDPSQKFFKTLFEAGVDKWMGEEVDVDRVVDALKQQSPVGVTELPPSLSAVIGYVTNKNFWLNEDIWRKTDKPFSYPYSREEFIPGLTEEFYMDVGEKTGLSPERVKYAVEEILTKGTIWSGLLNEGYKAAFGDLPKEMNEIHLAEMLARAPVLKRFIGITHPYSQYAQPIDKAKERADLERWIQNRGLDARVEGYLYHGNYTRKEIIDYMRSFKDMDVFDRLRDRFVFQEKIKGLKNRSFWLRLKGLPVEARAEVYWHRYEGATPEERKELYQELGKVIDAGGVITPDFRAEVNRLRSGK